MSETDLSSKIQAGVHLIRGLRGSSHSYVLKGSQKTALIDPGSEEGFPTLRRGLAELGLHPDDVDLVVNTHEHADHTGANRRFQDRSLVAVYRLGASKMLAGDSFVTFDSAGKTVPRVHLWLENMMRMDMGGLSLRTIHTPGHTSGSICLLEPEHGLLFSGDTLFAGGTLSYIAESGSVGDYLDSLRRLASMKVRRVLPGHGKDSMDPEGDIAKAIANAESLLKGERGVKITYVSESEPVPAESSRKPPEEDFPSNPWLWPISVLRRLN